MTLRAALLAAVALLCSACGGREEQAEPEQAPPEQHLVFNKGPWIWIADVDGRKPKRLVRGRYAFVSPDGRSVAYGTRDRDIHIVRPDGKQVGLVGKGQVEDWLPDSQRLLVWQAGLVVIDTADGDMDPVVPRLGRANVYGLDLSADGKSIAYASATRLTRWGILRDRMDIYVVPTEGGAPKRVTKDGLSAWPIWSGGRIVFSRLPRRNRLAPGVWRMNADGTDVTPLVARAPPRHSQLGFYGYRPYFADENTTIIGLRTEWGDRAALLRDDGTLRQLGLHLGHVSRDGRFVVGVQGGAEFPFQVAIASVDGGKPRRVASGEITWEHWNR